MVILKAELANVKTAHTRLVRVSTQTNEDAKKARTELRNLQVRFSEVVREANVSNERLDKVPQQCAKSAKATEEALRQLSELSGRSQFLERKATFFRSQLSEVGKARDDVTRSTDVKRRRARMLKSLVSLLKDELNSLKRKKTTGCDMENVSC